MSTLRYSSLLLFLFYGKGNPRLAYVFQHGAGPFRAPPVPRCILWTPTLLKFSEICSRYLPA